MWGWLTGGRKRHARVLAEAHELIASHGDRARYVGIEFARLTRDGKQVEGGKTAQFWWRVVVEIDRIQGNVTGDTATRYLDR